VYEGVPTQSVLEGEPTQSVYEPQPEMRQEEECKLGAQDQPSDD
jgi:hypothetical protein